MEKKYPKGHFTGKWMAICMAIFSGVGIPLSIATDNGGFIGIGPAIGVAVGLAIGQGIEQKQEKAGNIRPLTRAEQRRQQILLLVGLLVLIAGVVVFSLIYKNQ